MTLLNKLDRPNRVWFVISAVLVIVIAALVLSLAAVKRSSDASHRSLATAQCVNEVLSLRQAPAAQDSAVYAEIFDSIGSVLTAAPGAPQQVAYQRFLAVLQKDQSVLNTNQAFRQAHPLGRC